LPSIKEALKLLDLYKQGKIMKVVNGGKAKFELNGAIEIDDV
jgi:hypothetical protein